MEITETLLFWVLSLTALAGATGLVLYRNAVYCALFLILTLFSVAGLFLVLQAEFLAVIQVLVYAGAIMVLFLFVIMLLNMGNEASFHEKFGIQKGFSVILGACFVLLIVRLLTGAGITTTGERFYYGKAETIGRLLLVEYTFPFETIAIVLLVALIGAILIAKKPQTD